MVMPGELVTVVVPEIVRKNGGNTLLHNKTAFYIRTAFLFQAERRCDDCSISSWSCIQVA